MIKSYHLKLVSKFSALIVGIAGTLVLAGWLFNFSPLKSIQLHMVSMKPNAALCFLLSGIALWRCNKDKISYTQKTIILFCSFFILLIGSLTFAEYIFHINAGIDELLFKDYDLLNRGISNPGRMSPNSAANFILTGLAFLLLSANFRMAQIMVFFSIIIGFFALIGYLYSVSTLTNFSSYNNKMALHTVISILLLDIGILFSRPGKGFVSVILSENSGGVIGRPLLTFAVIVPTLLGWLMLEGQYRGLFQSVQFGVALLVITMIATFIAMIWWNARSLNRADKEKGKIEKELASLNAELEAKVIKRTKHLNEVNKEFAFQNEEKEKRAAELIIANKELAFQNNEKEKRAAELNIANQKLIFQNEEKEKRAAELVIANEELVFQHGEKEKRASELIIANKELKKAEADIRKLNEELEQKVIKRTTQLESVNKELESFSYSVSHDLRAPLRAVHGYTKILHEDYCGQLDSEANRLMNNIMLNSKKMGQLIDDLLAFSRIGRKELLKMNISIQNMVTNLCNEIIHEQENSNIQFKINELPPAHGDSVAIKQVWINLISNAVKYSKRKEKAVIEIGCEAKESEIIYYTKDNGAGFDMRYVNKLFGVFQRLHASEEFEGTGVGLAIVHRIISKHGGRVWAEGKVNEGAIFYFSLPKNISA